MPLTDDAVSRSFSRSNELQARLNKLVPGGAHTYARGPDQYPDFMAPVLVRGKGARVWDVDGNSFVEYGMGLRSVTLGHGYPPLSTPCVRPSPTVRTSAVRLNSNCTRPRTFSNSFPVQTW